MSFTELLTVADAPEHGTDVFTASPRPTDVGNRIFGGLIAAHAIISASRTVDPNRRLNSAQSTFLRPGDSHQPVHYRVTRLRDGRTFSTREVAAVQGSRVIFTMTASFQAPATGPHHQLPIPSGHDPETLPDAIEGAADETAAGWYRALLRGRPLDVRVPEEPLRLANLRGHARPAHQTIWYRSSNRLPDEAVLHDSVVTYCSDFLMLGAALGPHPELGDEKWLLVTTINHSIWFHAPVRADEWFVHEVESPWAGEGRAFCRGSLFDRHGTLIATTAQEGLLRVRD